LIDQTDPTSDSGPANLPEANPQEQVMVKLEDAPPAAPAFAVRFLPDLQRLGELDESLPLYQPPTLQDDPTIEPPVRNEEPHDGTEQTDEVVNEAIDVINRLQRAGIWRNPEVEGSQTSPGESHCETTSDGALTNVVEQLPAGQPIEVEASSSPQAVEVEDSIESYMQRLLERVRGSDGPVSNSSAYVFPVEVRPPVMETEAPEVVEELAEPSEPTVVEEKEYVPRSHAPESNINLSAMRELANDSRQQNMLSHAQRTWTAESAGKLLSAFAAFTVAFAGFFLRDIHSNLAAIGMVGGVGVGVYCLWQALSLRRRLFDSLRLDTSSINANQAGPETTESKHDSSLGLNSDERESLDKQG
jgi:hypothetical protein